MKILGVFTIILVLLAVSVTAASYNETGNFNSQFQNGRGFFNTELTQFDSVTRIITTQGLTPLVADLDNDSNNEIIIWDDGTIRLFQNRTLSIIDSFDLPGSEKRSNMITFDIDGDGFLELMIAVEETETLFILGYNGTDFFNQTGIDMASLANHASGANAGEFTIKCQDTNRCVLVYTDQLTFSPGSNHYIYATGFNSSDIGSGRLLRATGSNTKVHCMPKIRTMSAKDYDNDATVEFIVSTLEVTNGGTDEVGYIFYMDTNSSLNITLEQTISETRIGNLDPGAGNGCEVDDMGKFFTSPLVFDIDGSPSNGLETVVGANIDTDEFKMFSYKANGANLDDYPETFLADGEIISNVLVGNIFTDTGTVDFCTMGYQATLNRIDLLCASEQTGNVPETEEFILDISPLYNVTSDYGNYNVMTHSAQHSTVTTEGNDLDEIVNAYGVLRVDWDTICGFDGLISLLCLELIFENPQTGSSDEGSTLISVDAENAGRDDLILTTDTNIWYLDDRFVNSRGQVREYTINPCIDSTWRVNTSLEVRITPFDEDGDLVSARAILYQGDDNEQDSGWSANVSSGTVISLSNFNVNKTISTGILRLMARDVENIDSPTQIDLTFSVSVNGVNFNDCITESGDLIEANVTAESVVDDVLDVNDNAVNDIFQPLSEQFNLTRTFMWLIWMAFLAVIIGVIGLSGGGMIAGTSFELNAVQAVVIIVIVEFFMLILGTILGYISAGITISIVVVGLIIIGMWLRKIFTGSSNGGSA